MPKHIKPFLRAKILSFSYFFEYYSMCFLTRFLYTPFVFTKVCSKFCCSIFKDRCPQSCFFATALLLYHTIFRLSTLFFHFFEIFSVFFRFLLKTPKKARRTSLRAVHYSTFSSMTSTISFQTSSPGLPICRRIPSSMISFPIRMVPSCIR